jgi:hypothetical protein
MSDMTGPNELRLWIEDLYELKGDVAKHATRLRAAADAWEAETADWSGAVGELQAEVHLLNERLEAAEYEVAPWRALAADPQGMLAKLLALAGEKP